MTGSFYRLRAIAFLLLLAVSVILYAPLVALCYPLGRAVCHRLSNLWTRAYLVVSRVVVGIDCQVEGLENVPARPCVYFSKHQSAWETLGFQALLRPYVWILKREALRIPFFGWGLAALRPIAIDRSAGRRAVAQILEQGRARLAEGVDVLVFPEGTRVPPGSTRPFRQGGALLATAVGAPVVPIAHNTGSFWPARALLVKRPGTVQVVIGPPIETAGRSAEEVTAQASEWINATVARLESGAA